MYELNKKTATKRTYRSSITNTEISTFLLKTGEDKRKWWAFEDLLSIPFIRKKAAEKLTQLYGAGLTKEDLGDFIKNQKELLRGNDPEKYEKVYSAMLNLEAISDQTADVVKQSLSLCSVYILADDEAPDSFSYQIAGKKMSDWSLDLNLQGFFLNWLTDGMIAFTKTFGSITQIASSLEK